MTQKENKKPRKDQTLGEEIANAVTHGLGAGLAVAALVILIVFAALYGDPWHVVSFTIYGSTLVVLYLASTLYHSFPRGRVKDLFRIFDHAAIFLLIAGTYTPFTLVSLRGAVGWTIFGLVWGIAVLGIVFKAVWIKKFPILSTLLYIAMGWLIIGAIRPLIASINTTSLLFLVLGGVLYTAGTVFYAAKNLKFSHAVWHLFVLAGSICHFFTILYLLPA